MRPANDVLRFLLELAMLAAVAYWGFSQFDRVAGVLVGIGAPLLIAFVWATFMSPKASRPTRDPVRIGLEVFLFGSAVAALAAAERTALAIVLGALVVLHLGLTFPLGQRSA